MVAPRADEPREWSYGDLRRFLTCSRSLALAIKQLGHQSPLTARQAHEIVARAYQLSGAYYERQLPK